MEGEGMNSQNQTIVGLKVTGCLDVRKIGKGLESDYCRIESFT